MASDDEMHGFFVAMVDAERFGPVPDPISWNPYNKVVQDHRDGTIDREKTDCERASRGLPTPWMPSMGDVEVHQPPVY
jgi:hypothetical protein